jgi:hypothetical protein
MKTVSEELNLENGDDCAALINWDLGELKMEGEEQNQELINGRRDLRKNLLKAVRGWYNSLGTIIGPNNYAKHKRLGFSVFIKNYSVIINCLKNNNIEEEYYFNTIYASLDTETITLLYYVVRSGFMGDDLDIYLKEINFFSVEDDLHLILKIDKYIEEI